MAKLSPQEAAEKHARRLKQAIQDMQRGVEALTEAPGVAAAAKVDKMRANLLAAIDDGTWQKRVAAVPLAAWKKAYIEKGLGRVSAGIDGAQAKMVRFFDQLFSYQEGLKKQVDNMPDLTLDDSIQRMVTWVRGMSDFKPE